MADDLGATRKLYPSALLTSNLPQADLRSASGSHHALTGPVLQRPNYLAHYPAQRTQGRYTATRAKPKGRIRSQRTWTTRDGLVPVGFTATVRVASYPRIESIRQAVRAAEARQGLDLTFIAWALASTSNSCSHERYATTSERYCTTLHLLPNASTGSKLALSKR
jgi:hypothetical protein